MVPVGSGGQENFFDSGGTSVQAMQLLTVVHETFGVWIPPEVLFLDGDFSRVVEAVTELRIDRLSVPEESREDPCDG